MLSVSIVTRRSGYKQASWLSFLSSDGQKPGILLAPLVKRSVADTHLAANVLCPRAQLVLFNRKRNLLVCKPACLHDMTTFT